MEWLTVIFNRKKNVSIKTVEDFQREALVKQGQEQFQKLIDKGLSVSGRTFINED